MVPRALCAACAVSMLVLAGCGGHAKNAAPPQAAVTAAFKGSPPQLAALHQQANKLLPGTPATFEALLGRLRGYPVVVNKWASWCVPCQSEFPVFQKVAVADGRNVAFVGLNGKDKQPAASAFLRTYPVTYPSYEDPNENIARSIQAATYYPQTVFYDRQGRRVFDHAGPYESAGALQRDIKRYALG